MMTKRLRFAAPLLLAFCLAIPCLAQDFFWESPYRISGGQGSFPQAVSSGSFMALAWQESEADSGDSGKAYIALTVGKISPGGAVSWKGKRRIAGPIAFSGTEPMLFSMALGSRDEILLAYPENPRSIRVLLSRDEGNSFEGASLPVSDADSVSPRIFRRSGPGYLLFVTKADAGAFSIECARSDDGLSWSGFSRFLEKDNLQISFLPACAGIDGKELVVFQSLVSGEQSSYQLFKKISSDGGATWSAAAQLTTFNDPGAKEGDVYDNQNPNLVRRGKLLSLAWERSLVGKAPQIHYAELDPLGALQGGAQQVSEGGATCSNPVIFELDGKLGLSWSDNRTAQNKAAVRLKGSGRWESLDLKSFPSDSFFIRPLSLYGKLYLFWQSLTAKQPGIWALLPDSSVRPPELKPANFAPGRGLRQDGATVSWAQVQDSSGIAGYSFLWSKDPKAEPPAEVSLYPTMSSTTNFADSDGAWYFALRAADNAGNWSATSRLEFVRDTTPPERPVLALPGTDPKGFLTSNSFGVGWEKQTDAGLAGYAYALVPLPDGATEGDLPVSATYRNKVMTSGNRIEFSNIDNGTWMFEVAAIDSAGNVSASARAILKTDKFVPFTSVDSIVPAQDKQGVISLRIYGRGFTEEGVAQSVIVDLDGKKPYDREFPLADGKMTVKSDRIIELAGLEGLEAGTYRIGIAHPKRGLYFSRPMLPLQTGGTVKFGDFDNRYKPSWTRIHEGPKAIPLYAVLVGAFLLLCAAFILMLGFRLTAVMGDARVLDQEIKALIQGVAMPSRKTIKQIGAIAQKRSGLRLKFSLSIIAMAIIVVLMASIPLWISATRTQSRQLASSLYQRAAVLLESLVSGSAETLNATTVNTGTLISVTEQKQAMDEARYVTITGYKKGSIQADVIWASNDPDINKKTDSGAAPVYGSTVLKDPVSERMPEIMTAIQADLDRNEFKSIKDTLEITYRQYIAAVADPGKLELARKLENDQYTYNTELNAELTRIAGRIVGSVPEFDQSGQDRSKTSYIFYKPILRYTLGSDQVILGMVRLEVSTAAIHASIDVARNDLFRLTGIIALIAIGFGILGALFLSGIIIKPIKTLVRGIEIIRDTVNKAELANLRIDVRTGDELNTLSDTINQMTKGLVHGAKDNADLLAGEQDQRELLPLESDARRKKLSVGKLDTPNVEFYGYYKGAKLVSGDYLDFRSLDGRYYAFIKCDVSGKGVSAAMIMAIVASVFRRWFDGWTPQKPGFKLEELCYEINDTLNVCEFKGKFATLMVGIIDSSDGKIHLCHSGDKFYRVYENGQRSLKTYELPGTAPAGPFTADMIKMQSPYKTHLHTIAKDDILILYTDGIDEARRYWRDAKYGKIARRKDEPVKAGPRAGPSEHDDAEKEYQYEDFGNERAADIIEAIVAKEKYLLVKEEDPSGDRLEFDFSTCAGSLEDIVLGLVSVEKVFRMYKDPQASSDEQTKVDVRIDAFLKDHFSQYFRYCSNKAENPEERVPAEAETEGMPPGRRAEASPHYLLYSGILEDEQYDDITLLAIRKK